MNSSWLPISGPTQGVFTQLDPLLKSLLQHVTTYHELTQSLDDKLLERWILVVQAQVGILGQLSHTIQNLDQALIPGLVGLANYISLPLTAIFHISEDLTNEPNANPIVASHLRKLQKVAASTLLIYVEAISHSRKDGGASGPASSLTTKHVCQFLIALTTGIPYKISSDTVKALDNGTDCWLTIISAVQALLDACPATDLRKALDRKLVIRLVDCATSLLTTTNDTLRLESLQLMIDLMVMLSEDCNLWQSIFPGILADVLKCLRSTPPLSTGVQGICLQCIGQLIVVTLKPCHELRCEKTLPTTVVSTTTDLLQKIHLQATANAKHHSSSLMDTTTTDKPDFLSLVQEKAVIPLSRILQQSVSSKSTSVRLQLLSLCRVILVQTTACWIGTPLSLVALECCLTLQNDVEEDIVTQTAESVLSSHRQQVGTQDGLVVLTKIRSMVEELSVFAEGGKTLQLKLHLQLLKGYSRLLDSKELTAMSFPYQPFIQLMEVDFAATIQPARPLPILELDKKGPFTGFSSHQSKLPFLRLSLENAKLAGEVLEGFGAVLGHKQAAYAIDSILSDMLDAWANGKPTISMCQEWGGSLVVATKILIGAFRPMEVHGNTNTSPKKAEQKRRKILLSLASTVLPLLLNPPISSWVHSPARSVADEVMPPTLQMQNGIASIMILSLEFCSAATRLLSVDVELLLSMILYPIVEKAHVNNHNLVQEAARDAIWTLAYACNAASMGCFLQSKATHLLAEMQSCLRIPGGGSAPDANTTETLTVAASLLWVLDELSKGYDQGSTQTVDNAIISSLIEVCNLLMDRLDYYFVERMFSEPALFLQTKLYSAIFRHVICIMNSDDDVSENDPVKKSSGGSDSEKESNFPTNGVESDGQMFPSKIQDDIRKAIVEMSSKIHFRCSYLLSNDSLRVQISSCDAMTIGFRLLALVANVNEEDYDAEIRNAVFRQVALSWPSIKARLSNVGDEVQSTSGGITSLAFLTEVVPSSRPRKELATQRFFLAGLYQLVASMFECSEDFMADRFVSNVWPLLAKHFSHFLRAPDTHGSSRRLRPLVAEVSDSSAALSLEHNDDFVQRLSDSERHLLLSMEKCLTRVFACPDARESSITRIYKAVGLVLLPFMGTSDEEIAATAEDAIKHIVSQDRDVLRRPLLELSDHHTQPLPETVPYISESVETQNKDSITANSHKEIEISPKPKSNSILASRCDNVLRFMETLPEKKSQVALGEEQDTKDSQ